VIEHALFSFLLVSTGHLDAGTVKHECRPVPAKTEKAKSHSSDLSAIKLEASSSDIMLEIEDDYCRKTNLVKQAIPHSSDMIFLGAEMGSGNEQLVIQPFDKGSFWLTVRAAHPASDSFSLSFQVLARDGTQTKKATLSGKFPNGSKQITYKISADPAPGSKITSSPQL
jgi:hypothetical protein